MDATEFLDRMVAGYPSGLRPDTPFVNELERYLGKKRLSSRQWEYLLDFIRENCRMFPGMADLELGIKETTEKLRRETPTRTIWQSFKIGKYDYVRKVQISDDGNLILGSDLPRDAEVGRIILSADEEREDQETITYQEAVDRGYITPMLASIALNKDRVLTEYSGKPPDRKEDRFEYIGSQLGPEPPIAFVPEIADYDDSIPDEDWSEV